MDSAFLLLLVVLLAAAGGWLLVRSRRARRRTGLPAGKVVSSDTGRWRRLQHPLYSHRYRLTGRPDYLVDAGGGPVPVEVKSSRRPETLYQSQALQLAAYCLLVEETTGHTVSHGLLHYEDATVRLDFTPGLRWELLRTLEEMQNERGRQGPPRSHDEPARCAACGVRHACDQRLDG